jgi:uncharacterized protein (TIGR02145 family)
LNIIINLRILKMKIVKILFNIIFLSTICILYTRCKTEEKISENSITDADGNIYKTVNAAGRVWMAENLRTTRYTDGTPLKLVTQKADWFYKEKPGYSWYKNDSVKNGKPYGVLYNWYAINYLTNGNKFVCPTGWHVPTDEEWKSLINALGGKLIAGAKLKMKDTIYWNVPNLYATDSVGFHVVANGIRNALGDFMGKRYITNFWCSNEESSNHGWDFGMYHNSNIIVKYANLKVNGYSVRCIKDE